MRNVLALVGLAVILVVCAVLGWVYRAQLDQLYHRYAAQPPAAVSPADSAPAQARGPGHPSAQALRTARAKEDAMARAGGPGVVVLSADEVASLVQDGLVPEARQALDSIAVTFGDDRFTLEARVKTAVFGPSLGSFAALLHPYEPLTLGGPASVRRPGEVSWTPDAFTIRTFPFPKSAVPSLVKHLTGSADGSIPIFVPPTVGDLRIRPNGVSFYRKAH